MNKTLTKEEVEILYVFCKKHYVHHYDIQIELVDHLAVAIEHKMCNNPQLSFEAALDEVYTGFGVKGFAEIVAEKTKAMETYCRRQRWELYKSFFTWPKAAIVVLLIAVLTFFKDIFNTYERKHFLTVLGCLLVLIELGVLSWGAWMVRKSVKKLLIIDVSSNTRLFSSLFAINLFFLTPNYLFGFSYYITEVVVILFFVWIFSFIDFTRKLDKTIRRNYPGAFEESGTIISNPA